jgi:AraC family transcriptional regulator
MPVESLIPFLDASTLQPAPADVGSVLASSAPLHWDGVHVERGRNEHFETERVLIPDHYFVLLLSTELRWEARPEGGRFEQLLTRQGDVMVNPAQTVMSTRVPSASEFAIVTLSPERLMQAVQQHALPRPETFRQRFQADDPLLRQLMLTLLAEAESGGRNGRLFVESMTTALAVHYLQQYGEGVAEPRAKGLDARRLQRAKQWLDERYAEDLSLDELADAVAMSKFHFIRLFKASTGRSPYQYLIERRLQAAKQLLKAGELPIAQVAQAVGFGDQSALASQFKRAFGQSPSQWRAAG